MDEYESAKEFFEISRQMRLNIGKDVSIVERWIRKCDSEIKEENNPIISEPPSQQSQQSSSTIEQSSSSTPTLSTEITSESSQKKQTTAPSSSAAPLPVSKALPEIKYQYYQSSTSLNISVLVKNLTSNDVSVDFQSSHLKIIVRVDGFEGIKRRENLKFFPSFLPSIFLFFLNNFPFFF